MAAAPLYEKERIIMRKHGMLTALRELTGNPRLCVLTEPLWGIPHSLYVPFASIYMLALGATDVQIGLVVSLTVLLRTLTAMLSGAITDKLGRRRATVIFDIISWSIPCLLWSVAQNIWWFYAAAIFNGFWQVTENSWTCLLVEDADKRKMVSVYSWVYVAGQLSVFFAPLSALLVGSLGIIPAVRILYFFSFVSMTAKFIILYRYCEETEVGRQRLLQTRGMSLFALLAEYRSLVPRFFASGNMLFATAISVLFTAISSITGSFFGVFATQNLGVADEYLALFPIITSAIMLVFLFFVQPRLIRFGYKGPMLLGIALYLASHLALILVPGRGIGVPVAYTVLGACAHGLVMPRKDSLVTLCLDAKERARMSSILSVMMLGFTIPFGFVAGLLSDIHRSLPFVLNILLFLLAFALLFRSKELSNAEQLAERAMESPGEEACEARGME